MFRVPHIFLYRLINNLKMNRSQYIYPFTVIYYSIYPIYSFIYII
nr:MAG TPA: hypothetical protein [Caudoviricetes sp.]